MAASPSPPYTVICARSAHIRAASLGWRSAAPSTANRCRLVLFVPVIAIGTASLKGSTEGQRRTKGNCRDAAKAKMRNTLRCSALHSLNHQHELSNLTQGDEGLLRSLKSTRGASLTRWKTTRCHPPAARPMASTFADRPPFREWGQRLPSMSSPRARRFMVSSLTADRPRCQREKLDLFDLVGYSGGRAEKPIASVVNRASDLNFSIRVRSRRTPSFTIFKAGGTHFLRAGSEYDPCSAR